MQEVKQDERGPEDDGFVAVDPAKAYQNAVADEEQARQAAAAAAMMASMPPDDVKVVSVLGRGFEAKHRIRDGVPMGGITAFCAGAIGWQAGPVGRDGIQNGAQVEDVLNAAADRLQFFQNSIFACVENAEALQLLTLVLAALDRRTRRRVLEGKEGTVTI